MVERGEASIGSIVITLSGNAMPVERVDLRVSNVRTLRGLGGRGICKGLLVRGGDRMPITPGRLRTSDFGEEIERGFALGVVSPELPPASSEDRSNRCVELPVELDSSSENSVPGNAPGKVYGLRGGSKNVIVLLDFEDDVRVYTLEDITEDSGESRSTT